MLDLGERMGMTLGELGERMGSRELAMRRALDGMRAQERARQEEKAAETAKARRRR